jgi:hypothetical protein
MVSSSTSSGPVSVLRCPVLFNGTNYRDWVPRMHLHMRGLRLWDFLTSELPCPPSPSAPAQPVISEKTIAAEKEKLLADYEDHLGSYELQFHVYRNWLDEDARTGSVLTATMDDHFAVDIVDFEWTHQMWSFFVRSMSLLDSLPILLLFVRNNFFTRVTLQLRISLINFLLFGASLTLLALSYPLPPVSPVEIKQLHLSFVGHTTF